MNTATSSHREPDTNRQTSAPKQTNVVLLGTFPPPYGGVSIFNENLRRLLLEADYNVVTFNYNPSQSRDRMQARTLRENAKIFSPGSVCLDSARWLLESPATGNPLGAFLGVPMAWWQLKVTRRFFWIKIVHDGTLPERFPTFTPRQRLVFYRALRWIDTLVVVSENLREWFVNTIGYTKKIQLIPSLLPVQLPEPSPSHAKKHKTVCSIGVFTASYGFRDLADAVETLREEEQAKIALLLIDGGFSDDAAYRQETLANRDWIQIRREISHQETLQLLADADVFVRPIQSESYGLSRVEALWCGTPVIATKVGEQRGMHLFDFGDKAGLRHQLQTVLKTPPLEEVTQWALVYAQEAQENLHKIELLLGEYTRTSC